MKEEIRRLKQLRAILDLKQMEFGQRIGIKGNSYSQIETGKNPLKDRHIALICHVFGVNENWLRKGEGEVFNKNSEIALVYDDEGKPLSYDESLLVATFKQLSPKERELVKEYADMILKNKKILQDEH